MTDVTCCSTSGWCARADALLDLSGFHVLDVVHEDPGRVVVSIETDADIGGCPTCGVVATGHGRRVHTVADAPCFGASTLLAWRKRIWRCAEPSCPVGTFSERHEVIAPRAKLTTRAVRWATDALEYDDTTVSALARHLGVDWHTLWDAIEIEAIARLADPERLGGVSVLGVDEHIWRPSKIGDANRAVTGMVDLTRDEHGRLHARWCPAGPGPRTPAGSNTKTRRLLPG